MSLPAEEQCRLCCYNSEQIDAVWAGYAPFIQKALDHQPNPGYTLDDIYDGLKLTAMQLWCWGHEACLVTTIQEQYGKKWCHLLAIGGSAMKEWLPYLKLVEDWAKSKGCEQMQIYGRIGWSRVLGYDVEHTKMVKDL